MGRAAAPRPFLARLRAAQARREASVPPRSVVSVAPPAVRHRMEAYRPLAVAAALSVAAGPAAAQVAVGSEFRVNTGTVGSQTAAAAAMDADGDFVVVWHSGGGYNSDIYAQRYDAAGVPQGPEFRVNTISSGGQSSPSVAMDSDGDFVVAWESQYDFYYGPDGSGRGVYAQRFDSSGIPQGAEFLVNSTVTYHQLEASVSMDADGDFVVAWHSNWPAFDNHDVYAQRYDALGTPQGGEFQVNTFTTERQNSPSVAMDADGDFVVAWMSEGQDGSGYGVYARRYDADGTPQGVEFGVNTVTTYDQGNPSVAMDADGDFVVAWDTEIEPQPNALSGWVTAQRYDALGAQLGPSFGVGSGGWSSRFREPSVAMDADGDFIISLTRNDYYGWGDDNDVQVIRYHGSGAPNGGRAVVNTFTAGSQSSSSVAMDDQGNFVVAWTSAGQDGSGDGVYAQRYASGVVAGEPAPAAGELTLEVAPSPLTHGAGAVRYAVPAPGRVRLALYDALGRQVALLADGDLAAGAHEAELDSAQLPPGVFLLRLEAGGETLTRPVTVTR